MGSWIFYYVYGIMGNRYWRYIWRHTYRNFRAKKSHVVDWYFVQRVCHWFCTFAKPLYIFFLSFYWWFGNWRVFCCSTNLYLRNINCKNERTFGGHVPVQYCVWNSDRLLLQLFIERCWWQ